MRSFVSDVARDIKPSGIRKFFDLVLTMEGDVISLGVGEPDFDTPWSISKAAITSIEKGMTMYTSNRGLPELCGLLSEDFKNRYGVEYDPKSEIIFTTGVSEGLDIAMRAVVNPGDEVLVVDPCFVSYQPEVYLAGGVPKALPCRAEDQFKITPESLMEHITPKTKVLMMNFPNNPTGGVMDKDDLKAISDIIIDHDLLVISDEVYSELSYDLKHTATASIDGLFERTITLNGFSKAYAMTGWRLGYLCAPKEICDAALKIHQYAMMSAPTASQFAAIEALKSGEEAKDEMVAEYRIRRNLFVKGLNDIGLSCHLPQGAFYAFPSIESTGLSDEEFAERLLKEQQVAVVPGSAFGESGKGHVRTCYAVDRPRLTEAVRRIGEFVESL
ncbi:MAG TPA: aminotransferase class I/II-fold pyridoxal phosphate-dependent enzyme [Methanocorpusculum sp.]|jgi:aminotransferase|nr:aminotransferase class I/II-fold pyridoxal phosphate-dependent enzyme [Methanocorpusculum sp.]HJJ62718.1 aminotransferase class I/II-fold pyridoxal phosphate-dependent enzyme [Methanocorpusculum sp.]HJJ62930.1 aminotransferase class I/II-fold pyridoxal phosphate-dependent enzyme [Methanocorpusculum sp.]HJJ68980.1 aminotransferase class I/II-fold pyridoxal phosphate-dependent enzyme [Methanocorpusculum sp.]HJJ77454.1 aminotransferase class I/II-fold pyridoxal phosphate-dependent enzyme [Metha